MSEPSPGIEEQRSESTGGRHTPSETPPISVRILQSDKEAAAEKAREKKSDDHETADLAAQQKAADAAAVAATAADRQVVAAIIGVILTILATGIAGVGTCYLIATFRETKKAADAAKLSADAAKLSADAAIAAQRPWLRACLAIEYAITVSQDKVIMNATVKLENVGNSPATVRGVHDLTATICEWPYSPMWAVEALQRKLDRRWGSVTKKGAQAIFPRSSETIGPVTWEEKILPKMVPEEFAAIVNMDDYESPFTSDDLVVFVGFGVSYDFLGGEGRTECVYAVARRPNPHPTRASIMRSCGTIDPKEIVCTRIDSADVAI